MAQRPGPRPQASDCSPGPGPSANATDRGPRGPAPHARRLPRRLRRSRTRRPPPPSRPRSPTPCAGRRAATPRPRTPRTLRARPAQCAAQPWPVAPGNRGTPGGAAGGGGAARATGPVPGEHWPPPLGIPDLCPCGCQTGPLCLAPLESSGSLTRPPPSRDSRPPPAPRILDAPLRTPERLFRGTPGLPPHPGPVHPFTSPRCPREPRPESHPPPALPPPLALQPCPPRPRKPRPTPTNLDLPFSPQTCPDPTPALPSTWLQSPGTDLPRPAGMPSGRDSSPKPPLLAGARAGARKGELPEAGMEPGERKRLSSASLEGDPREENSQCRSRPPSGRPRFKARTGWGRAARTRSSGPRVDSGRPGA